MLEAARAAPQLPLGIDPDRALPGRSASPQVRTAGSDLRAVFLNTMSAGLIFYYCDAPTRWVSLGMNWFRRWPFVWLLATLLLLLVFVPAEQGTPAGRMVVGVLITLVYLASFLVVFTGPTLRRVGLLLCIPALVGTWVSFVFPELPRLPVAIAFHSLAIAFLVFTTVVTLQYIFRLKEVSTDEVAGALCGYLLIGVAFGHAYCLAEELAPGSFRADGDAAIGMHDPGRLQILLTYFSFVTLTTVGYGDITATRGATRGLAMVEAIVGQFYIAVLIADVIGKKVGQALSDRRVDGKEG